MALMALCSLSGIGTGKDVELHVVVQSEPHRQFTPMWRRGFREQLGLHLNQALQGIGRARVFDFNEERADDRLPEWTRAFHAGLDRLNSVPHTLRVKTHYVTIGISGAGFDVSSRQFDGELGWCSPVTRKAAASDRNGVIRLALDQILSDLGLTARIESYDGERNATVRFSHSIGGDGKTADWVRSGDPFALIQLFPPGRCEVIPHAYFIVTGIAEGGVVQGKIEYRFVKPLAGWESGQFRVVKLGARTGPLRLRLIGQSDSIPADVGVQLFATGMGSHDAERERGMARAGRFNSVERYDRVAFAKLHLGEKLLAKLPLVVMDNNAITVELNTDAGGESALRVAAEIRAVQSRLSDQLVRIGEENDRLRVLLAQRKNRQALSLVTEALGNMAAKLPAIEDRVVLLRSQAALGGSALEDIQRGLRDLKLLEQNLLQTKKSIEEALAASGSQDQLNANAELRSMIELADQQIAVADFELAIQTLDRALKQAGQWPEVQTRLERLRRDWRIQSDEHRRARQFVYQEWSRIATVEDAEKLIDQVQPALATFGQVGDRLSPRKVKITLIKLAGWIERDHDAARKMSKPEVHARLEKLQRLSLQVKSLLAAPID